MESTADYLFFMTLDEIKASKSNLDIWFTIREFESYMPRKHLDYYDSNIGFVVSSVFGTVNGRDYFIFENKSIVEEITEKLRDKYNAYKGFLKSYGECRVKINPKYIDFDLNLDIVAESKDHYEVFNEGKSKFYFVKKYERNLKNREQAIAIHGTSCAACGMDYESIYGELGKDFIEIHHVVPVSSLDREVEVNPQADLIPLCANCHRMIHRNRNEVLTVDSLKAILKRNRR